jgi:DNA (cytosine-5)-methyltransferase 1
MMRVLDLFSGIGGFNLGLERAGMQTIAFCEIDPFCRQVLRKHWPDVPIYEDIRTLNGKEYEGTVDLVCGGFPCQPFSQASAGRAKGAADDRFLWPEMRRVISEIKPRWVLGENVAHIDRLALDQVVSDLEALGYEVGPPLAIPACAVGQTHWRTRYWFLGYANRDRKPELSLDAKTPRMPECGCQAAHLGTDDGVPRRMDRLRALGNAVVPQIPELIGRAILTYEQQLGMAV